MAKVSAKDDREDIVEDVEGAKKQFSSEEAKKVLADEAKLRCEQAAKETEALCEKYQVNIVAITQIIGNNIQQAINFVAR